MAELSLSSVGQQLEVMANIDPLAPKSGDERRVTGAVLTNGLPEPVKSHRMAVTPGSGGYPGANLLVAGLRTGLCASYQV